MRQVAELIDGVSVKDNDSEIVSSRDAAVLNYLKSNLETFQENNEKLSVVLGELVKMLNLDGSGVDVYLLHYVSDVMQSHRELLTEIEDIDYKVWSFWRLTTASGINSFTLLDWAAFHDGEQLFSPFRS